MNSSKETFSLYIHIPYCIKKCPYCDFNSYAVEKKNSPMMEEDRYCSALIKELELQVLNHNWRSKKLSSIFFGGGTPSLFSENSFEKILSAVNKHFPLEKDLEITLEANPGTVQETLDIEKLEHLILLGINRISFGAQSFLEKKLKFLGRIHSKSDTARAVEHARKAGFKNLNLDLIFGTREETLEEWSTDLKRALELSPEHISAYNLTIEPGTDFGKLAKKGTVLSASDELSARMFSYTQETLAANGFRQYEISNYAKAERACVHNQSYWSRSSYLALGAGAHGFINTTEKTPHGFRYFNLPGPAQYMKKLEESSLSIQSSEVLTEEQAKLEFFLLGLRQKKGIMLSDYEKHFAESFTSRFSQIRTELEKEGLIAGDNQHIFLTSHGFLFANSVFEKFAGQI